MLGAGLLGRVVRSTPAARIRGNDGTDASPTPCSRRHPHLRPDEIDLLRAAPSPPSAQTRIVVAWS